MALLESQKQYLDDKFSEKELSYKEQIDQLGHTIDKLKKNHVLNKITLESE